LDLVGIPVDLEENRAAGPGGADSSIGASVASEDDEQSELTIHVSPQGSLRASPDIWKGTLATMLKS
jgi:hypothetical protein